MLCVVVLLVDDLFVVKLCIVLCDFVWCCIVMVVNWYWLC